jgi:hypothetical protein
MDDSTGHVTDFLTGGISFISRRRGWAFDNVRNFEVSAEDYIASLLGLLSGNYRKFK